MTEQAGGKLRIDKWLWYARVVKTRSLAQALVKSGKVRCNTNRVAASSHQVLPGDVLTIALERQIRILKVVALGTRRGPAPEAQGLYEDMSPPPTPKDPSLWTTRQAVRDEGAGRPTKKERRDLMRLRDQSARSDKH